MKMETLNKGNILLDGKRFSFETYMLKKSENLNGLWRMLRIHDRKGNEIITLYNVLKDNLNNMIITSLRDRNILRKA